MASRARIGEELFDACANHLREIAQGALRQIVWYVNRSGFTYCDAYWQDLCINPQLGVVMFQILMQAARRVDRIRPRDDEPPTATPVGTPALPGSASQQAPPSSTTGPVAVAAQQIAAQQQAPFTTPPAPPANWITPVDAQQPSWPTHSLTPGGFTDALSVAVANSKKALVLVAPGIRFPITPHRDDWAIFPHVFVEMIFGPRQWPHVVVMQEYRNCHAAMVAKVTMSAPAILLVNKYKEDFGLWLASLTSLPNTADQWRLGMQYTEGLLLQIALAQGGATAMEIADRSLKDAYQAHTYDYAEIKSAIKMRTVVVIPPTPPAPTKANTFFRGRNGRN